MMIKFLEGTLFESDSRVKSGTETSGRFIGQIEFSLWQKG